MGSSENCADISVVRGQKIAGAGREVRGQLFGVEGGGTRTLRLPIVATEYDRPIDGV